MNDRDKIVEKIKKLLALADNNSSEAEAIAAALKAQKLIADYNIDQSELYDVSTREVVELETEKYSHKYWRKHLAKVIADNFRCKHYFKTTKDLEDGFKSKFIDVFVGYDCDAQAAKLVYHKLVEVGEARCKDAKREAKALYGTCEGVTTTFLFGFVDGVSRELEKQCVALMLVTPKDVLDHMENSHKDLRTERADFSSYNIYVNCTEDGVQAGRDAVRAGRMEDLESNHYLSN